MKKTHIIVIPGNPGIVEYYDNFANSLKLNGYKVTVLNYDNFSDKPSEKLFSIKEELYEKKEQILKIIDPKDRNVLVGHSIGCWISLKLMSEIHFDLCVMIFPFLRKSFSFKQLGIGFFLNFKDAIIDFYNIVRSNKHSFLLLSRAINSFHMSHSSNRVTKDYFLNKDAAKRCLSLAKTEFETLSFDFDIKSLKKFKDKLIFYYCKNDIWAPESDFKLISQMGFLCSMLEGPKHDFCVRKDDVEIVSKKLIEDLK